MNDRSHVTEFNRRDMMAGTSAAAGWFSLSAPIAAFVERSPWSPDEGRVEALHQAMCGYGPPGLQIAVVDEGAPAWRRDALVDELAPVSVATRP